MKNNLNLKKKKIYTISEVGLGEVHAHRAQSGGKYKKFTKKTS